MYIRIKGNHSLVRALSGKCMHRYVGNMCLCLPVYMYLDWDVQQAAFQYQSNVPPV